MPVLPLWSPFALLAAVCVVYPLPAWTRKVDWYRVTVYTVLAAYCLGVWALVGFVVWRVVW